MMLLGSGVLERCDFSDTGEGGEAIVLDQPPHYWFVLGKRLVIRDSSFRSSSPGKALLDCWSDVLIRGSTFVNLPIEPCSNPSLAKFERGVLGIANSTFEPPLDASVATVQPPDCSVAVAGERVCDERAQCDSVPSGGVRCACVAEGMRYKPGWAEDGRRCEQSPRLRAMLSSASLALTVRKVGSFHDPNSTRVLLTTTAEGEEALSTSLRVTVSRTDAMSGITHASSNPIAIDQPSLSAFGMHLDWDNSTPPAQQTLAKLNGNAYKYRDTQQHGFRARFECAAGSVCAADGDTISIEISYASPSGERIEASAVKVIGTVQSVPSCSRTGVTIEPSETLLPHSAPITLSFTAVDCDAMPINNAPIDFDVKWDGQPVACERDRGGNGSQYVSTISDSMRQKPGPHTIVVALRDALNESTGRVDRCVIFRRTVLLRCASGTMERFGMCEADTGSSVGQMATGGAIAAFMVLGLGVLGYVVYRHRERAKDVLISFLSFEGALAFECACRFRTSRIVRVTLVACSICTEAWDVVGDIFVFLQFRHESTHGSLL
jgi:hypothetical protein